MKVRRINVEDRMGIWDVVEESRHFYISKENTALPKSLYEPVPEPTEQWRDVTSNMRDSSGVNDGTEFVKDGQYVWAIKAGNGYRLRKVQFTEGWGFTVERKESHD